MINEKIKDSNGYLTGQPMYKFNNGYWMGVLMTENVMRKIVKLNAKYMQDIRQVLINNKDELLVSDWTLANKYDGEHIVKQVVINYTVEGGQEDLDRRISTFKSDVPKRANVYIVNSHDEAKEIAESVLVETLSNEECSKNA